MVNARVAGRLNMVAVALGSGAAVALSPVAVADSSGDLSSAIDTLLTGASLPAASSPTDLAISFDGYSLVSDGNATATTTAGDYDLAIAYGNYASATATGGTNDIAIADGSGTDAYAENGKDVLGVADGLNSYGGAYGDNNVAIADGANSYATSYDGTNDFALADGSYTGADAVGNSDVAAALDPTGTLGATAVSGYDDITGAAGNSDIAAVFFQDGGFADTAVGGSHLVDILPSSFDSLSTFLSELTSLF